MPVVPCPTKIDCFPCQDEPILNVSAEAIDVDRYLARFSFLNAIPPIRQYPDFDEQGGGIFLQVGCMRWCWSTVSQDDADDCARRQAIECAFGPLIPNMPMPDEFHPNRIAIYYNIAQVGTYACPDGNVFSYTVAANVIVATTPGAANAIAFALAKQRAREHRVCISNLDDPICVDTWATKQITASGPNVAVFPATDRWELVSGTIPTGMTLETGFTSDGISLSGIPTTIGEYSFRVRVTISTFGSPGFGDFMEKVFTVKIVGIEQSSPLTDAVLGVAYSQQLSAAFSSNHELEAWSITSGSLPDGLTLSTAGLISGTPEGPADTGYSFTVQAQFPVGTVTAVCSKQMSITTSNPAVIGYWKFDENSGIRFDSRGDADFHIFTITPSTSGLIGNAIDLVTTNPATEWLNTAGHFDTLAFESDGFTIVFWTKLISNGTNFARFTPARIRFYDGSAVQIGGLTFLIGSISLGINFPSIFWNDTVVFRNHHFATAVTGAAWRMVTVKYRPDGFCTLILDDDTGSEIVTSSSVVIPTPASADWTIFSEHNFLGVSGERYFDEMGYFNRQLTNAEIVSLYNAGAGRTYPDVP